MAIMKFDDFLKQAGGTQDDIQVFSPKASEIINDRDNSSMFDKIKSAFLSSVQKTKEGYNQSRYASNPLELLEGSTKAAAGIVEGVFSPLAPVVEPIGKGVQKVADKIADIPGVQKFASSKAGEITQRAVDDIANLNTVVGAIAAAQGSTTIIPKTQALLSKGNEFLKGVT